MRTRALGALIIFALLAMLALLAAIGFGLRFRRYGRDLDSWFALSLTLVLFADLHYVLSPTLAASYVLQGDFLRLLAYAVLLFGVWRAIGHAEFGRAVAEERARVAREIHDGLAQYLFALSTHVSMLERGAALDELLPRLKQAATALHEARFAVLALSFASGTAPFDAALRRYASTSSQRTACWRWSSTSTPRCAWRPTSRSRSSGSCRKGSPTHDDTPERGAPGCRSSTAVASHCGRP